MIKSHSQSQSALYQQLFGLSPTRADQKKLEIIKAALLVIHQSGFASLSFGTVAKVLKMKAPHIVYYFPSMEALLQMVIRYVTITAQETTIRLLKEARSPREQLVAFVRGSFDHVRENPPHKSAIAAFYLECVRLKEFQLLHKQIRKMGAERVQAILASQHPHMAKRDLAFLSSAIQALITGYLVEGITTGQSTSNMEHLLIKTMKTIERLVESVSKGKI